MTTIRNPAVNPAVTASGNPLPVLGGSPNSSDPSPFSTLLQQHVEAAPPEPVVPVAVPVRSDPVLNKSAEKTPDQAPQKTADRTPGHAPEKVAEKAPEKAADQTDAQAADQAGKAAGQATDKAGDKTTGKTASKTTGKTSDKIADKTADPATDKTASTASKDATTATDPLAAWLAALHGGAANAAAATAGAGDANSATTARAAAGEALAATAGGSGLPPELGGTKLAAQAGGATDAAGFAAALAAHGRGAEAGANALGLAAVRMLGAGADASALTGQAGDAGNHLATDAAAQAAALGALGGAGAAGATTHGLDAPTVAAPVGSAGFANELADQVQVLVSKAALDAAAGSVHEARLNLNPAEMGPIAIRIALDGKHAQVDFAAASGATRQALQDSMPALASALNGAGLTLSGGGVSQQFAQAQQQSRQAGAARGTGTRADGRADGDTAVQDITTTVANWVRQPEGRLDLYV